MNNVPASALERIRGCMVGLRMPRAPEALNATSARFEQGDSSMLKVLEDAGGGVHDARNARHHDGTADGAPWNDQDTGCLRRAPTCSSSSSLRFDI